MHVCQFTQTYQLMEVPTKVFLMGLSSSDANALGLTKTSKVGNYFVAATAPGVIMTYAELLFLKAEFAYKGVTIAGDAATNYAAAITASFAQYKLAAPTDYIAANALKAGADGFHSDYGTKMDRALWTRTGSMDRISPHRNSCS